MSQRGQDRFLRMLLVMRNHLAALVEELNEMIEEYAPTKDAGEPLRDPSGKVLANVTVGFGSIEFEIVPEREVPVDSTAVQNFLIRKILDGLKVAGCVYHVEDEGGLLRKITVEGAKADEVQSLRRTIAWTIINAKTQGEEHGPEKSS